MERPTIAVGGSSSSEAGVDLSTLFVDKLGFWFSLPRTRKKGVSVRIGIFQLERKFFKSQ